MPQPQSIFFYLPREIRDEIYRYYVSERSGYHYDAKSKTLRTADGRPLDLALCYTCRDIAREMAGVPLSENVIMFRANPDLPDNPDHASNAERFENLLDWHGLALQAMLSWASECVTPGILTALGQRYPEHDGVRWLREADQASRDHELKKPGIYRNEPFENRSVLADLVELISHHPKFLEWTAREYCLELRETFIPEHDPPVYATGSQRKLLEWKPAPWLIPTDAELDELDALLPQANIPPEGAASRVLIHHISATASAIQFLEQLAPDLRNSLRKIVIREDHASGHFQPCHAQGLISLCKANSRLRVENQADLWRVIFLPSWNDYLNARRVLRNLARWVSEALLLRDMGMPSNAYTLTFQSPLASSTQQICDAVKRAAAVHEALEWHRRTHPQEDEHPLFFSMISEDFVSIMKEVFIGKTFIRFDAHMGGSWDLGEVIQEQEKNGLFPDSWDDVVLVEGLEQPLQGWEAMRNEYIIDIDWADRLEGWGAMLASA